MRNPDYWKRGRPYLDGIEYTIIRNLSTAVLGFVAGKFDTTFLYSLTVPLLNDAKSQLPRAICELTPGSINRNLLINRDKPPFDGPDLRRAMALSLDRHTFIDIITEGQGDIGGVMQPAPAGLWGMPPEMLNPCRATIPTCRRTGRKRDKSCRHSATIPITISRSK
jgi:peptide/nickel transport system substrate-binding protein